MKIKTMAKTNSFLGVIFTLFIDFTYESIMANAPLILGVIVSFIIEEILVYQMSKKEKN